MNIYQTAVIIILVLLVLFLIAMFTFDKYKIFLPSGIRKSMFIVRSYFMATVYTVLYTFIFKFRDGCKWVGSGWYMKSTDGVWEFVSDDWTDKSLNDAAKWFETEKDIPYSE